MKNLKNIVLFTIISLLLFCGCSQENKSASDTVNPQDGKSVSEQQETIVDSEKAAENVTDKMSLLEAVGEGHVYLTFPNFDELSVGEIRDGQSNKSVLLMHREWFITCLKTEAGLCLDTIMVCAYLVMG